MLNKLLFVYHKFKFKAKFFRGGFTKDHSVHKNSEIKLFGNRIEVEFEDKKITFDFNETSAVTVLGRNKLNIYHEKNIYQIIMNIVKKDGFNKVQILLKIQL